MMRFFTVLIVSAISTQAAWSNCERNSVEVPFNFKNEISCYSELNLFSATLEAETNEKMAKFAISFYETEHHNIPHATTQKYLNIETDAQGKPTNLLMMSYLCSDELPIASDAYSVNLSNLLEDKWATDQGEVFISTGQAAETISVGQRKKMKAKIYDKFLDLYEMSGASAIEIDDDSSNVYIPNLLLQQNPRRLSQLDRQIISNFFTNSGSSVNGCSKKFKKQMGIFSLDRILKVAKFEQIEIRENKNSQKIEIFWEF